MFASYPYGYANNAKTSDYKFCRVFMFLVAIHKLPQQ